MDALLWDLMRATEAAAAAALPFVGRGDKPAVDRAATTALRETLNRLPFAGRVVIGEGKKDLAPGLFAGEWVGLGRREAAAHPPAGRDWYDLAVDPVDGTGQAARAGRDALAAVAVAPGGGLFGTEHFYTRRVVVGPGAAASLGWLTEDWPRTPAGELIEGIADALGRPPEELVVCVLDRPRHLRLLAELRPTGCRIELVDCDVSAAVAAALPGGGVDVCIGTSGAPETVLTAAAVRCLGGDLRATVLDRDGVPVDGDVLTAEDLAAGPVGFVATGLTGGYLLRGAKAEPEGVRTHSLVLSSEGRAVRWVETLHRSEGSS